MKILVKTQSETHSRFALTICRTFIRFVFYVCVQNVCAQDCRYSHRPESYTESSGAGVTDGCEMYNEVAEN